MCRVEQSDWWTLVHDEHPRAAKEYRCGECGRAIKVGETYERHSLVHDGEWDVLRTCEHCQAARKWLEIECRGWVYEQVYEELVEHWYEDLIYRTVWLGRVIAGMKHRWHDGRMSIPSEPPVLTA